MKKRSAATVSASSSTFSNSSSESSSLTSVESNPKRPKSTIQNPKTKKPSPTRSSVYRGVTRHRWTGRFEAHLWDKESWNSVQTKKGRQVYLGAYDCEEAAARTYDLAAIKYWGPDTAMNFSIEMYDEQIEEMQKLTREEYLATLRRRSSGFSRGVSKFRGVAKHHQNGRWEARIGRVLGNKYLYLGTYSTQEEAAAAYDRAAIQYRGANAVTNFDISNYGELSSEMNPLKVGFGKQVMDKQEQQPQQLNLKIETNAREQEIQQHHQPKSEDTEHVRYSNAQDSCAMEVMMNEDELCWDLNMNPHFNELTVLNMSDVVNKSGELHYEVLPALFEDYSGFEDDLDFMFSSELKENGEKVDDSRTTVFTMVSTSSSSSSVTCLSSSPTYSGIL